MNAKEMAKQIETTFRARTVRPFPYEDFHKLYPIDPAGSDLFWTYYLLFEADVAGYTSSASRFLRRTRQENDRTRKALSLSFFEAYPEYAVFEPHITQSSTPALFDCMQRTEKRRLQLLALFNLLSEGQ